MEIFDFSQLYIKNNLNIQFIKHRFDVNTYTLNALADISQNTQVIFFTHHRHLAELADKHINSSFRHSESPHFSRA
jgi:hypothetical protein